MAFKDIFKISRKTFLDVRGWIGYDSLVETNRTIWTFLAGIFTPDRPLREETFENAMVRLKLSENDVEEIAKRYRLYAVFFVVLGILLLIHSLFLLLYYHTISGWLIGFAASCFFFSQAFRFDFWAFQIRRRKLGATLAQWRKSLFSRSKG